MKNIINKIRQLYPVSDEALHKITGKHAGKVLSQRYLYSAIGNNGSPYLFHRRRCHPFCISSQRARYHPYWFSQEGDVTFGMDSLYYKQPSIESIETLSDCKIYVLHIDELNALYEKYIDIANWGRILHQDVNKELSHMFVERLQLSPKERYEQFNRRYPGLINRVKLKYVAAFLGISIYTLSRVRAKK